MYDDNEQDQMKTGWVYDNGCWYYYYSNGEMATGWMQDGKYWYYFNPGGTMGWSKAVDGYYLGYDGKMVTSEGWQEDDKGNQYYVGADEKVVTGWKEIDGKWYYFNYPGGTMGWSKAVDGYYLAYNGEMVTSEGWEEDDKGNWYYVGYDKKVVTGWKEIDGKWYYFDEDGKMQTGWIQDNGCWYYLDSDGSMSHDTTIGGYLLKNSGKMVTGTGWQSVNGNWYYLNDDKVETGWLEDGDNWYYLYGDNGSMAWGTTIDGYYLGDNGEWKPNEDDESSNSQGTSDAKTVNVSMDINTGTIVVTDSDNISSTIDLPTELYDMTKDSGLANSSKAVLAKATIEWYNADTQDDKDIILAGIKGVRNYISEHSVSEWTEKFIADTINENIGGLVGIYGDYATGLTDVIDLNNQVYYTKYAHVMRLVLSVTTDALNMGNKVHYDQLNGGTGEWLPTELQRMYPETQFNFTRRGQSGADVEFEEIPGNRHPSEYEVNPMRWPEGFNYGDFKPYTGSGYATFLKDINKGKLPDDTAFLPYDPQSGKMKVPMEEIPPIE